MKLLAPNGLTSMSLAGIEHKITAGIIDVAEHLVPHLLEAFGFKHIVADDMAPPAPAEVPTTSDPDKLNRNQLFAALKKLGVAVAPPITNEALRALLKNTIAEKAVVEPAKVEEPAVDDAALAAVAAAVLPPLTMS